MAAKKGSSSGSAVKGGTKIKGSTKASKRTNTYKDIDGLPF
jgi:hypothetical protein